MMAAENRDAQGAGKTKSERADDVMALFALGRFIDYRLEEGMDEQLLKPFMQAYFNLQARIRGQAAPDLDELRSRAVADTPELQAARLQVSPNWLPDCEKLEVYRPIP